MDVIFYLHLVGACVWVGGLITLATIMPAVRRATGDRHLMSVIARRFGLLSWIALGVLVITGLIQAGDHGWTGLLLVKASLVLASIILAVWHSLGARTQLPAVRGVIQATILLLALTIIALATAL